MIKTKTDKRDACNIDHLFRNGFNYTSKRKWTIAHMRYLRELTMPSDPHKIVLEESI